MVSYGYLIGAGAGAAGRFVEVREDRLRQILRPLLGNITVDEDWYRGTYGDVEQALQAGTYRSARDHYVAEGYFEDRLPRRVAVDEPWDLNEYADVAEAVRRGAMLSAQEHFFRSGFREGRLPCAGWSLVPYPSESVAFRRSAKATA